ncbi:hypothetical protein [Actinotignum timonense]
MSNKQSAAPIDRGIAQLTVIANESYRDFAAGLQAEYKKANIAIGFVREGEFAKIKIGDIGKEHRLGFTRSKAIYDHLTQAGFVDKNGVESV